MLVISCRCTAAPAGPLRATTPGASPQASAKHFYLPDSAVLTSVGPIGVDILAHKNIQKEDELNKFMKKKSISNISHLNQYFSV